MITPAFSPTATERVLPRLALDFTTASLDARVSVARALNTATRINSSGLVESVNANLPRFDYTLNTGGSCNGLLIEEQRTNLSTYSEDFRNTADAGATRPNTYINMTLAQNATTSPYGVANSSDKLVETSATGNHGCFRSGIITSAGTYAYTVRIKPGERNKVQLSFGSTGNTVRFTLQGAGSVDYQLSATGFIRASADGWYYCTMVASPGSATSVSIILMDEAGSISYAGDPTKGLYVDCIQVETGAFATSYIPNLATGTTTRNADVVTMTGTNFSDWYNASEGTFFYEWLSSGQANGAQRFGMTVSDGTANNRIRSFVNSSTTQVTTQVTTSGVSVASLNNTVTASTGVVNRTCAAYKLDSFASSSNASAPATDTLGGVPSGVNQGLIGSDVGATGFLNGTMKKISYWPQCLTNAEVQAFSK